MAEYVVNPILWFMHQRMKQLTIPMLCKLITQYYKSDEIECARDLLFNHSHKEHCPRHLRKKVRQSTQKLENTVKTWLMSCMNFLLQEILHLPCL